MIKNLEYIIKVAEYQSISKAAEKLYITSAALSKFVINVENELGIALFDRTSKKFTLTYAGEKYVEWAKKILILEDCMNADLRNIAENKIGILHFGFQLMLARSMFAGIIPIFKAEYPNIELTIESSHTAGLFELLENNTIDFIISSHKEKKPNFEYTKIDSTRMVLIVHKDHPIAQKGVPKKNFKYPWIDINDLAHESFVALKTTQSSRIYMDKILDQNNIKPKINMQVHTTELTYLSVSNGHGITVGYDLLSKSTLYKDSVKILSFGEYPEEYDISIIRNKASKPMSEPVRLFIDICTSHYSNNY